MSCEPERSCTAHSVLPQPIIPFGNPGPCTPCKVPTCPSVAGSRQQPAASSQRRPHSMGSYSCFGKDKMVPPATKGLLECDARGQEGARGDLKTASRMQAAGPPHREGWRISQAQEQEGCTHRVTQMAGRRGGSYGQQRVRSRVSLSLPPPPPRAQMQLARRCTAHGALFSRAGTGRLGRRATAGRRPEPRLYTRRRPPRRQAGPWGGQTWPSPTHGAPPPQVCSQCVWCITQGRRCPGR